MPSSQDQSLANQHQAAGNYYSSQAGASKPSSSGSRRAKGRRKYDSEEEDTNGGSVADVSPAVLASSPLRVAQNYAPAPSGVQPSNGISSPLLAALASYSNANTPQNPICPATEWANNVQLGQSPPDKCSSGNSIAESPPNPQPPEELRGGFSHASPPTSPSAAFRRPVRPNNGYQSFGEYLGSSPGRVRPVSMQSQRSIYPPPPHQPQAHYFGAPEIDFGIARPRSESRPPMEDLCCTFDTLVSAGEDGTRATEDVLMVGSANGLIVYSIGRNQSSPIGRLDCLRGSVLLAKILPAHSQTDELQHLRPLVAVVIHGLYQPAIVVHESRPGSSHSEDSVFDASGSMLQVLHATEDNESNQEEFYQTTVEIFSLKERKHVSTLLSCPKTKPQTSQIYPYSLVKPQAASLQIQASQRFIVIASGSSGEVFVFNNGPRQGNNRQAGFKCIGKFWTRASQKRARSLSVSSETSEAGSPKPQRPDSAMFSLSHRWLAIVPPVSSTQSTLHMSVNRDRSAQKVAGLTSHTAPTEPSINCETDVPEAEGLFNKVARDMTQEFMKGALWVGDQGKQAWSNYWSRPATQTSATAPGGFPIQAQPAFPPTHANNNQSTIKRGQSTTVSIIDLEKLGDSQHLRHDRALQPVATFALPNGCGGISFAPSGLHLLTISMKGDIQQIWSLMRMLYGEPGHSTVRDADGRAPFVREIKRFTRMTVANVVDVAWSGPIGDNLAILTERGTVHIYNIPTGALQWPPPRRILRPATIPNQASPEEDTDIAVPATSTSSAFGAALNMVTGTTQPLLAAVRGRPASVGSAFSKWPSMGFPAGAGAKSGKLVAAGFNRSVTAATSTVNSLQHMGENRVTLPGKPNLIKPGCVRWLGGKAKGLLAVTGSDIIRIHTVAPSSNVRAGKRRLSVTISKASEYTIPSSQDATSKRISGHVQANEIPQFGNGFWNPPVLHRQARRAMPNISSLSCAEINTNAPYQPFHTDRRVGYHVYSDDTITDTNNDEPWAFGEYIPTTKISAGSADVDEADEPMQSQPGHLENLIQNQGDQLVVTTRRKRNKDRLGDQEVDFFEDDCEVIDFADDRV